ncbi:hypothetical protein ILUMI_07129 [Ignelater luminosus]|uniref:Fibronectin type-III domain-containing protein n=1 Tax=Ignelater luminosus TaxID=2038154 RepID=A0A8K0D4G4_IGNLU|nr:hypothetical protein ILUMI_07129 [Ignelater luminosus]
MPQYRKSYNGTFYFVLNMTNVFGTTTVKKNIFHFAHVIPNPPDGLTFVNTTSESIYLRWTIPTAMKYFRTGLKHRIMYRSEYEQQNWQIGGIVFSYKDSVDVYFNLTGLQYAYAQYEICVSMQSAIANQKDHTLWSKNSTITLRTAGKIPASPPLTNIGSFEVVHFSDNRANVYVYWQQVQDKMKNGGNFGYHIEVEGSSSNILPVNITDSYAKYENLNLINSYTFHIWSKNDLGKSESKSVVIVPKSPESVDQPVFFRKTEYGDGKYELFWESPNKQQHTTTKSYTIFWCTYYEDRPYQCAGYMDWEEIPGDQTYYTTTQKVPEDKIIQFAISANSDTSSSGMVWACTIVYNKTVAKLQDVLVTAVNSTAIRLIWRLDCLDGIESVQSYIIYYCSIPNDGGTSCAEPERKLEIYGDSKTSSVDVNGLEPYQRYKVAISVVNRNNRESLRSDYKIITTLDDPPDPPASLSIVDVTNSTIFIKWERPNIANGRLKNYKIKSTNTITGVTIEHVVDSEQYNLTSLKCYVTYKISVEACTNKCSRSSDTLSVRTRGGYPTKVLWPISPFKNSTDMVVEWKPPEEPNGNCDTYEVKLERTGNVSTFNVTDTIYIIKDCDADEYGTFTISVRAVNVFDDKAFFGPWSDELVLSCKSSSNLWMWSFTPLLPLFLILVIYLIRRLTLRYKKMQNVEVILPPGLEPSLEEAAMIISKNDVKPQNKNKRRCGEGNLHEMKKLLNHKTSNKNLKGCKSDIQNSSPSDSNNKLVYDKVQKAPPCMTFQECLLNAEDTADLSESSSKPTSSIPSNYCVLGVDVVPHKNINPNYVSVEALQSQLHKSKSDLPQVSGLSSGYVQAGDLNKISNANS